MSKFLILWSLAAVSHFATAQNQLPQVAAPAGASLQFQQAPGQALTTPQPQPVPSDLGPPGAYDATVAAQQAQQQQAAAALLQQQQLAAQKAAAQAKGKQQKEDQQLQQMMQQLMSGMSPGNSGMRNGGGLDGNPRTYYGDDGPQGPNGTYSDNQRFWSGNKGAGNIGTGLCTSDNASRTQMTKGYCQMLKEELNREGSCAKGALDTIMYKAKVGKIKGLNEYCPNFDQHGDNGRDVFLQVLASLVVQESGWKSNDEEREWYKNGQAMGGKGLFQIGPKDANNYPRGCAAIRGNIMDPKANIACGSCIALTWIALDEQMGIGANDNRGGPGETVGGTSLGMARYFGPLRNVQEGKRNAMKEAVQKYCRGNLGTSVGSDYKPGSGSGETKK